MILALLGFLLFSLFSGVTPLGDVLAVLSDRTESSVAAGDRRDRAIAAIERASQRLDEQRDALEPVKEGLLDAIRAHDASRERLTGALRDLEHARSDLQSLLLDLRFELRAELTREEWAALFPAESASRGR